MTIGSVYLLTHKCDDKIYVGQTIRSFEHRKARHIKDAIGSLTNMRLHKAMRDCTMEQIKIDTWPEHWDANNLKVRLPIISKKFFIMEELPIIDQTASLKMNEDAWILYLDAWKSEVGYNKLYTDQLDLSWNYPVYGLDSDLLMKLKNKLQPVNIRK